MRVINISEAKATLSKLIAEVERGNEVVIGRAGKPVAKLVPFLVSSEPRDLDAGTWKGKVWLAADFATLPADLLTHFKPDPTVED